MPDKNVSASNTTTHNNAAVTSSSGSFSPASLPDVCAPRRALLAAIDAAAGSRLIYMGAQAGSGKTVSALLWLTGSGREAVWLGLDRYDNSPVVFYRALATGLFTAQPGNAVMREVLMSEGFASSPVEHTIELIAAMAPDDKARALVIDDMHFITNAEIIKSLPLVLKRLPANFVVLGLSRHEFPEEWASLINETDGAIIPPEMLRFSKEEISGYFDRLGKPITPEARDFAFKATEGWAIGVNAIAHGGEVGAKGYFETGLWDTWDTAVRNFCLRTSVVDEFDIELAQVLTGLPDAGAVMEQLARTNSFMSRLHDDTYRYHHLFLEFLRERAAAAPRLNTAALHKKAARYYRKHKDYNRALRSWIDSGEFKGIDAFLYKFLFENSKEVISQHADFLNTVFDRNFPEEAFVSSPALYALAAWYYYLRGDHVRYEAHMDKVYDNLPRIALGGRKFVEFAVAAYSTDYRTSIMAKVKQFKRIEPYTKLFTRHGLGANVVSITHNMPYLHRSNIDYSDIALEPDALDRLGSTFGVLLGSEWIYVKPGLSAGYNYERDRLDAALRDNEKALSLISNKNRIEGLICMLVLRHSILWRQGKKAEAEKALARLRETTQNDAKFFIPNLAAYEARLALADGDKDTARAWLENYFVTETEKTAVTEMISSYRDFTTARAYIVLDELVRAQEIVNKLKAFAADFRRPTDVCEAGVLESILLWQTGQRAEAVAALEASISSVAPYGYVRTVADEGAAILPVLKRLAAAMRTEGAMRAEGQNVSDEQAAYRQLINEMILSAHSMAKAHKGIALNIGKKKGKPAKLSKRQKQMVTLLSQGYNNPQISELTGLAIPTIKTHLFYAYQKLNVNNAMDAVLKARALGLIERGS
jgi:LuxR family maltose regulon positive regulatory protein